MALSIIRPYVQFDEQGIATGLFAHETRTLTILVIEDDPSYAGFLKDCFGAAAKDQFRIHHSGTLEEGLAAAEADSFDLVLLDLSLPDSAPDETFQRLHQHIADIPVVILTGGESSELAEAALLHGAQDFLLKTETNPSVLTRAVRYAIERHQYHRLLLESETRHRTLVEQARDGILIVQDERYRFVNRAMAEMSGYTVEELIDMPFLDLVHPADRDFIADRYRRRLLGESVPGYYETTLIRKDGEHLPIEISASVITFDGEVATHAVVRDVSRRRLLESQVLEQMHRNDLILQQTNDGFLRVNCEGRILEANQSYARLVGYSREELHEMNIADLEVNETPDEVRRHCDLIRLKGSHRFESRHRTRSGDLVDVEVSANYVRLGEEDLIFSFFRDITHRRRMENRLHLLYRAMEQCPSIILISNAEGEIEYVNQKFTAITGYTLPEIIGRNVRILKSGKTNPDIYRDLWKTINEGHHWNGIFYNCRKNGEYYWQSTCILPVRDDYGTVSHFLSVAEDVTELYSVREELARSERLAALGRASAEFAHCIKNISSANLNSVHYVEEAFATQDEELMKQALEVLRRSTMREYLLLMNVLKLSKERKHQQEKTWLPTILDDIRGILDSRVRDQGIGIDVEIAPDAQWLFTDSNELFQCLLNLSWNAVEAMAEGGRLSISATRDPAILPDSAENACKESAAGTVLISVSDTGEGIPPEVQEKIFSPFFSTKGSGGTGLGLASVKDFIKREGGSIDVTSEPGRGTVFHLRLPAAESEETDQRLAPRID